jgi:PIN domain nuclease of toxin-antitoxin system
MVRFLLDTHVLLWWLNGDPRVSQRTRSLLADPGNAALVSIVSLWEMLVKHRAGKMEVSLETIVAEIDEVGFERLGLTQEHLAALSALPFHHRDPFDHLLIAQAIAESLTFVSADRRSADYPVQLISC